MDRAVNEIRGEGVAPEGFTYAADTLDRTNSGVSGTSTTASFEKGKLSLEQLADLAKVNGEPAQISGQQELYESIVNQYIK